MKRYKYAEVPQEDGPVSHGIHEGDVRRVSRNKTDTKLLQVDHEYIMTSSEEVNKTFEANNNILTYNV